MSINELIKTHPEEVEQLLEEYSRFLEKEGHMDCDWYTEKPQAVLAYLEIKQK